MDMPQLPPGINAQGVDGPGVDALEASFGNEDTAADFGEVFTDLTDFLLESVGSIEAPAKGGTSRKRTATEALLDAMENEVDEPASPTSPVDHNDYTLKPRQKRARASTVASYESEAESTVSSVASTSVAAAVAGTLSSADKQTERRVKNNIASRRSRQTRKQKFADLEEEAVRLQQSNKELKATVATLQEKVKKMKEDLIARLAKTQ